MFLIPDDLAPFATIESAKALAMIEDAEAQAAVVAPCITGLLESDAKWGAVRAILRRAVLRWDESGSGALSSQQMGPFSQSTDTRQQSRGTFWPSEITQLQGVCATSNGAFAVDTVGFDSAHLPWCSLSMGATYCSCGVDIAGVPIFELG